MRITERQLRQIIKEELSEMRRPESDPPKKHTFGTKVLSTHLPLETLDVDLDVELDFEEKKILSDISDEHLRELIKNPDGPAADRLESEFAHLYVTLHDMTYLDAESEAWKKVSYLKDNNVFKWELWRRKQDSGKFDPPMGSAYHRLMRGPVPG